MVISVIKLSSVVIPSFSPMLPRLALDGVFVRRTGRAGQRPCDR
jgi:hypothetical protein